MKRIFFSRAAIEVMSEYVQNGRVELNSIVIKMNSMERIYENRG